MKKQINCSNDYASVVTCWVKRFSDLMRQYSNAATAILVYYLRGRAELVVCPDGMDEFKLHGEAMRHNGVMFAAAEESGLLAEAVPELFRLALKNYDNWYVMNKDILYLLQHQSLCRYIPFEYRFLAENVAAVNALVLENKLFWETCVAEAKAKLVERKASVN